MEPLSWRTRVVEAGLGLCAVVGTIALVSTRWLVVFAMLPLLVGGLLLRERTLSPEQFAREQRVCEEARAAKAVRVDQRRVEAYRAQELARLAREAQLPPLLREVALDTDAGPACPACNSTQFVLRRADSARRRVGVAAVLGGVVGGAALLALNPRDWIECAVCASVYRRG
ncbi:hypothetical protein [Egicoccus sp. AB-alg2]|uniref:hypothetical protein n=1 Tax=Egicoccus sp. AB-alg2 TaxID=3242693 RepID=UPI00359D1649